MARKNTHLTSKGIEFITYVCIGKNKKNSGNDSNDNNLLKGNNGILQYSNKVNKTWEANIIDDNGNSIKKNGDLPLVLVSNFQRWATTYNIDPNILAAQCYILTKYKMWYYESDNSGINLFTMPNVYKFIISNSSSIAPKMTEEEISIITAGLTNPDVESSYDVVNGGAVMTSNRPILHQNMIDNPAIMIKAQARYLKYLADNQSNKLASTSLFSYSAGEQYAETTYTRSIEKANNLLVNKLVTKATDIVLKTFGVLGDKDNATLPKITNYKPKGYYFGYDLKLKEEFDSFSADTEESKRYDDPSINQTNDTEYSTDEYVLKFRTDAVEEMVVSRVLASITLAQGIVESGNGNSYLARNGNNHFGIKCHSTWDGPGVYFEDGRADVRGKGNLSCFRKYATVRDSYRDHSKFLIENSRYNSLFDINITDDKAYVKWAIGLQDAGYAAASHYANALINTIRTYELYKYDEQGVKILKEQGKI
jgi:flagellum-specific peptidoglycan hydrolase FlgJ